MLQENNISIYRKEAEKLGFFFTILINRLKPIKHYDTVSSLYHFEECEAFLQNDNDKN